MNEPEPSALQRNTIGKLVGGFVLCTVVAVYVDSRWHGHWPPNHPWSGIALTAIGLQNLLPRRGRLGFALAVFAACSSLLWAWASLRA